jgi:mono/diheme cytochrome c family protein
VSLLLVLSLPACDRLPGRPDPSERYQAPDAIVDPVLLFSANCSGCHGEPGRVGPARDLGDPLFLAVIGKHELLRVIAEGVAGTTMPAFAQSEGGWLTETQIDALASGILARWGTPVASKGGSLPPYSEADARKAGLAPGDPGRGATAFASYCASCHGTKGTGGSGGSIVDGSFLALVSDQALRSTVIAGRPELGSPSYRDHPGQPPIGLQQISDLTAWLAAQRRPFPGRPYAASGVAAGVK